MSISASIFQAQDGVIDAAATAEAVCGAEEYWCDETHPDRPCFWGTDVTDVPDSQRF